MRKGNPSYSLVSVIGYGTFITKGVWNNKQNVEVCLIKDFIRIFPEDNWFPFVLPYINSSFYALKFEVTQEELSELDYYEGVSENYFKREKIDVLTKNNVKIQAYIYLPSEWLIKKYNLSKKLDKHDRWREEIKKFPEIIAKFPELVL